MKTYIQIKLCRPRSLYLIFNNMNIFIYTCMYLTALMKKEAMNLEERKDRYMEVFGCWKGKGSIKKLYYNLKE